MFDFSQYSLETVDRLEHCSFLYSVYVRYVKKTPPHSRKYFHIRGNIFGNLLNRVLPPRSVEHKLKPTHVQCYFFPFGKCRWGSFSEVTRDDYQSIYLCINVFLKQTGYEVRAWGRIVHDNRLGNGKARGSWLVCLFAISAGSSALGLRNRFWRPAIASDARHFQSPRSTIRQVGNSVNDSNVSGS